MAEIYSPYSLDRYSNGSETVEIVATGREILADGTITGKKIVMFQRAGSDVYAQERESFLWKYPEPDGIKTANYWKVV